MPAVAVEDVDLPVLARELDATICWFGETPLRAGDRLALKHTSRTVRATVQALHSHLDPETLDEHDNPVALALNDIGTLTLRTSSVVVADPYASNRDTGAFILIDEASNDTVGAGTILEPREVIPGKATRNDIKWHPSALSRNERWTKIGQRGATVWLTGLPASGKSTVAVALERAAAFCRVVASGRAERAERHDGHDDARADGEARSAALLGDTARDLTKCAAAWRIGSLD